MAVGDVARLVGQYGVELPVGGLRPDVDRAEERERGDPLFGAHQRVALRADDRGVPAQAADAVQLPQKQAAEECGAEAVDDAADRLGRQRRFGQCRDDVGRSGRVGCGGRRRGEEHHFAGPYGDVQQGDDARQCRRHEQVGAAPAEADPPFEQEGVGGEQQTAAGECFEQVYRQHSHGREGIIGGRGA